MVASLDPLAKVFAEASKGKQAVNMDLLPITPKGEPGYWVEKAEQISLDNRTFNKAGPYARKKYTILTNILHLKIRGKKVKVWSRFDIDRLILEGCTPDKISTGKRIELRIHGKRPCKSHPGRFVVDASIKIVKAPQTYIFDNAIPEKIHIPAIEIDGKDKGTSPSCLSNKPVTLKDSYQLMDKLIEDLKAEPEEAIKEKEERKIDVNLVGSDGFDDMPEYREVKVSPTKTSRQLFWNGAPYANESEIKLGQALHAYNQKLPDGHGLVHSSNVITVLKGCAKKYRKPDFEIRLTGYGPYPIVGFVELDGSAHNGRHLGDEQKHSEFVKNGLGACIYRVSAERAKRNPAEVVEEIVIWLKQLGGISTDLPF